MSLVGKKAPLFAAPAVVSGTEIVADFSLSNLIGKKEIVLFFCPKDFTFLCPAELLSFQELLPEFEKRDVAVIGVTFDKKETNLAWLLTSKKEGDIEPVTYPLITDVEKSISTNYGVLRGEWDYDDNGNLVFDGALKAFRGIFLIDKEGIVRHECINFFSLGKNITDTLRVIDAWQFKSKHGEVYPT